MEQIRIDYSRNETLTQIGQATLKDRYLLDGETPQDGFARAAVAFSDSPEMAQRIYDYASKFWLSFSTPILSNAPVRKSWASTCPWQDNFESDRYQSARGLPISCYLNYVPDSLEGIGAHWIENMYLASRGGGIGSHWSAVRSDGTSTSRGSASNGIIPFIKVVDSEMSAVSQGKTRRGSCAVFLDISHPEIEEFLVMRKPTGGDLNRKALNLHHGVNISDKFMHLLEYCFTHPEADDAWPLVDPHTQKTVKTVSARRLWEVLLETRVQTGEPYIVFIDTVNKALPPQFFGSNLQCNGSNLCVEITLPTAPDYTAVCCLSSVNLATFDEWNENDQFIEDVIRFLDNVIEYFIRNAGEDFRAACESAKSERSLGLGALGFHTLLQKRGISFESASATALSNHIFSRIHGQAVLASKHLARERGAPIFGCGQRNAHLLAVAPNASSSLICGGVSPSIEPIRANAYLHKTLSGSFLVKNPQLEDILNDIARHMKDPEAWLEEQWSSIITNKGSVQHLDYLSEDAKNAYKTAIEINQRWVVQHASARQPYICQAQSLNLFLPPDVEIKELSYLHYLAWKSGVKTLYYLRSEALRRAEVISTRIERTNMYTFGQETACIACEG